MEELLVLVLAVMGVVANGNLEGMYIYVLVHSALQLLAAVRTRLLLKSSTTFCVGSLHCAR